MFNQIVTVLCISTTLTRSFNLPNMTAETTTYRCSNHEISCLECCTIFPGSIHNNVCFFTKIASSETIKLKTLQYIFFSWRSSNLSKSLCRSLANHETLFIFGINWVYLCHIKFCIEFQSLSSFCGQKSEKLWWWRENIPTTKDSIILKCAGWWHLLK